MIAVSLLVNILLIVKFTIFKLKMKPFRYVFISLKMLQSLVHSNFSDRLGVSSFVFILNLRILNFFDLNTSVEVTQNIH